MKQRDDDGALGCLQVRQGPGDGVATRRRVTPTPTQPPDRAPTHRRDAGGGEGLADPVHRQDEVRDRGG